MSRPSAFAGLLLVAATALPGAAFAQPVHITVPGGYYEPPLPPSQSYDYYAVQPPGFLLPFDPAGAAQNALAAVPWAHHVRVDYATSSPTLASTIARTGDSLSAHWIKCQARYSSYNLVNDTYVDRDGVPHYCTF